MIVRSLVGEWLQIRAMSSAVARQRGEGTGVGQRGEAEGSPPALRPVSLMQSAALPIRLSVGCNAEQALRKSIPRPLGGLAFVKGWRAGE